MGVTIGLAATLFGVGMAGAASFKGPLGLQLYSLRAQFAKDVPGTLKQVQAWGFRYAELAGTYNLKPEEFKKLLQTHKIQPVAGHFAFERWRDDPEGTARQAKTLGLRYAGCGWIPHQGAFDEKVCRQAIAVFNKAGAVLARHGLKFFYHQHGYEFRPWGTGTLMDLMMQETDPKQVTFEMDIFWVHYPGQDPARWLEKYPKRWELVHLKDMKKGVPTGDQSGRADVTYNVPLGTGQLDMPAILRAARKAGVKWYFIEDESPTVLEQIPISLKYLREVRF